MLAPTPVTFPTKLGKTRAGERSRIWIEGARLTAAGFTVGKKFHRAWSPENGLLILAILPDVSSLARSEYGTVSGKGEHPIIDIVGAKVIETFATSSHVHVTFRPNVITIEAIR